MTYKKNELQQFVKSFKKSIIKVIFSHCSFTKTKEKFRTWVPQGFHFVHRHQNPPLQMNQKLWHLKNAKLIKIQTNKQKNFSSPKICIQLKFTQKINKISLKPKSRTTQPSIIWVLKPKNILDPLCDCSNPIQFKKLDWKIYKDSRD